MAHKLILPLLWECWRLSRRWYLWVLPMCMAIVPWYMSQAESSLESTNAARARIAEALNNALPPLTLPDIYNILATPAFMLLFIATAFTTGLAVALGNRGGFPLRFEFRLPVRSSVLVAVPMLYLGLLCASLYAIPAFMGRLLTGIPFPVLSVSMVLGTLTVILLTCSWALASTTARLGAAVLAIAGSLRLFRWLDAVHLPIISLGGGRPITFTSDVFVLEPREYLALAALCLALYGLTLVSIRRQRCSEQPLEAIAEVLASRQEARGRAGKRLGSGAALQDRIGDLFTLPCPVTSAWRAELWVELKRTATPILAFSALLMLAAPLMLAFVDPDKFRIGRSDYVFPLAVFVIGVGYAVFNRRLTSNGYMSAFEGSRGMSTLQLMSLQMLAVGASCLVGMLLVCVSLYLSAPLFAEPGDFTELLRNLPSAVAERSALEVAGESVRLLGLYLGAVALFGCVSAGSTFWGRYFPIGMALLSVFALFLAARIGNNPDDIDTIKRHMWAFAIVVLVLTLFAAGRTLFLKVLSLRAGLAILLCWGLFVICSLYAFALQGS